MLREINQDPIPNLQSIATFSVSDSEKDLKDVITHPWWLSYHNESLTALQQKALSSNYSLKSTWLRLAQMESQYQIYLADLLPRADLQGSGTRSRNSSESGGNKVTRLSNFFSTGAGLSYEIDLWGKIKAQNASMEASVQSTREDVENTALFLTGRVADLWVRARAQYQLLKLLDEQKRITTSLLELTKSRFEMGRGSVLDIYQQEQQLQSVLAELPVAKNTLEQLINQIAVLVGESPMGFAESSLEGEIPEIPPFPSLVTPLGLLDSRPDLRSLRYQLVGADNAISVAMAARLPQLSLSLSYNFQAAETADLFSNQVGSLASNILFPLFDGGRRAAQVDAAKARLEELNNTYTNAFLVALQDVENAIVAEKYQLQVVQNLEEQTVTARRILEESRNRYLKGLIDYFQVASALQSVLSLERRAIFEKTSLLLTRHQLYLALGGTWTKDLSPSWGGAS